MSGRFVAFVMIAGLLAGCGGSVGDRPHTGPVSSVPTADPTTSVTHSAPPSPARPTIPADVPRTGPNLKYKGEQPPVMPVAATQHTRAGAVAFAEFFIKTMDWGYASVSSTYMRHYFTAACKICDGLADAIDRIKQKDYQVAGNRFAFISAPIARRGGMHSAEFTIDLAVSVSSAEVVNASGLFVEGQPALKLTEHVGAKFGPEAWSVVSMGASR